MFSAEFAKQSVMFSEPLISTPPMFLAATTLRPSKNTILVLYSLICKVSHIEEGKLWVTVRK